MKVTGKVLPIISTCGVLMALCVSTARTVAAEPPGSENQMSNEAASVQLESLKKKALQLNRELFILEEDLLFPASTQVGVYLSMDVGDFFQLDSVELKLDDEIVATHLFTDRQVNALHRGGIAPLYLGNLKSGQHEMTAIFIGIGPQQKPYKRATALAFEKNNETTRIELVIKDSTMRYQPEFTAVEW
jgi:hypothetical protein